MNKLSITVALPPMGISPNARSRGWQKKHRLSVRYREECGWVATATWRNAGGRKPMQRASVLPVFYFKDNRRRDKDNFLAMLKPAFDALQDAGVIENDSGLSPQEPIFCIDRKSPRVVLVITEIS